MNIILLNIHLCLHGQRHKFFKNFFHRLLSPESLVIAFAFFRICSKFHEDIRTSYRCLRLKYLSFCLQCLCRQWTTKNLVKIPGFTKTAKRKQQRLHRNCVVNKKPEEKISGPPCSHPPPPPSFSRLLGGGVNQKVLRFSSLRKGGDCQLLPDCSKKAKLMGTSMLQKAPWKCDNIITWKCLHIWKWKVTWMCIFLYIIYIKHYIL